MENWEIVKIVLFILILGIMIWALATYFGDSNSIIDSIRNMMRFGK